MRIICHPSLRPPQRVKDRYLILGCTYCLDRGLEQLLGDHVVNLSQPAAAINLHLRNLELLEEQQVMPRGLIWVTPDPSRITVFDHADRVLRWGPAQEDRWHTQGQTPDWDLALRLRSWQRAAASYAIPQLWLTWSQRTHSLTHWPLVPDPDSESWPQRLAEIVRAWAK